jgi:toxin ParE1/3/4
VKRFRVTRMAERDLDEIWSYIARDNVDAANHLVDALAERFSLISQAPKIGRNRNNLRPGLRSHAVDNYVIYYQISDYRVEILHVIHGARDPQRVFGSTKR